MENRSDPETFGDQIFVSKVFEGLCFLYEEKKTVYMKADLIFKT